MKENLKIVYSCNDAMFDGVYLSILSIVRRTKANISFYLLTADLTLINPKYIAFSKEHELLIDKMVKEFNPMNSFKVIDATNSIKKHYSNLINRRYSYTPFALLRTLLFEFDEFKNSIVLYLDADTMANNDISKVFELDVTNHEFLACRDVGLRIKYFKKYFNAGVMLFNMVEIQKTKLFQKVIEFLQHHHPIYLEQDALNKCCVSPKEFPKNQYRFNYQWDGIKDDTIIKHFLGIIRLHPTHRKIRQWDIEKVQKVLKLHNWDEDYEYFLKEKSNW